MENQTVNPIPTTPNPTPVTPNMGQIMMPGAIMYMVFGIVSVVLCWYFWIPWVGIVLASLTLVFAVLAFLKGKKMQKEYDADPNKYKKASKAFIKVASITGLIGVILSSILIVVAVIISVLATAAGAYSYY